MWEELGKLLLRRLEELRLEKNIAAGAALLRWPEVAGRLLGPGGAETTAVSVKEGTLHVEVSSGIWASEIRLKAPQLIKALNQPPLPQPVRSIKTRLRQPDARP